MRRVFGRGSPRPEPPPSQSPRPPLDSSPTTTWQPPWRSPQPRPPHDNSSPNKQQAQFLVTEQTPKRGLAVWSSREPEGAVCYGAVTRGQVVVGLEPLSEDSWLRIQWLAAPDCSGWIHVTPPDAADDLELVAALPGAQSAQAGAAELHAGTHSKEPRWRVPALPSLRSSPKAARRLSKAEEANVKALIRRREEDAMRELIAEELEEVERQHEREASARTEAHCAFFDEVARRLRALRAFASEGIFRVPGAADAVSELQRQVEWASLHAAGADGGSVQQRIRGVLATCDDPHDMASLLGRWLREQYPMVPPGFFPFCATAGLNTAGHPITQTEDAVESIEICVDALPQPGQGLLRALIGLLQEVDPEVTRMTPENLGRVFAPTVIHRSDPTEMISMSASDSAFVTRLILLLPGPGYHEQQGGGTTETEDSDFEQQVGVEWEAEVANSSQERSRKGAEEEEQQPHVDEKALRAELVRAVLQQEGLITPAVKPGQTLAPEPEPEMQPEMQREREDSRERRLGSLSAAAEAADDAWTDAEMEVGRCTATGGHGAVEAAMGKSQAAQVRAEEELSALHAAQAMPEPAVVLEWRDSDGEDENESDEDDSLDGDSYDDEDEADDRDLGSDDESSRSRSPADDTAVAAEITVDEGFGLDDDIAKLAAVAYPRVSQSSSSPLLLPPVVPSPLVNRPGPSRLVADQPKYRLELEEASVFEAAVAAELKAMEEEVEAARTKLQQNENEPEPEPEPEFMLPKPVSPRTGPEFPEEMHPIEDHPLVRDARRHRDDMADPKDKHAPELEPEPEQEQEQEQEQVQLTWSEDGSGSSSGDESDVTGDILEGSFDAPALPTMATATTSPIPESPPHGGYAAINGDDEHVYDDVDNDDDDLDELLIPRSPPAAPEPAPVTSAPEQEQQVQEQEHEHEHEQVSVLFREGGRLGISFDMLEGSDPQYDGALVIGAVAAGSLASQQPQLFDGLVLVRVDGMDVRGMDAEDVLDMLRAAGRPLGLGFARGAEEKGDEQEEPEPATATEMHETPEPSLSGRSGWDAVVGVDSRSPSPDSTQWSPRSSDSGSGYLYETVSGESEELSDDDEDEDAINPFDAAAAAVAGAGPSLVPDIAYAPLTTIIEERPEDFTPSPRELQAAYASRGSPTVRQVKSRVPAVHALKRVASPDSQSWEAEAAEALKAEEAALVFLFSPMPSASQGQGRAPDLDSSSDSDNDDEDEGENEYDGPGRMKAQGVAMMVESYVDARTDIGSPGSPGSVTDERAAAHYHRVRILAEVIQEWALRAAEGWHRNVAKKRAKGHYKAYALQTTWTAWLKCYFKSISDWTWKYGILRRWFRHWVGSVLASPFVSPAGSPMTRAEEDHRHQLQQEQEVNSPARAAEAFVAEAFDGARERQHEEALAAEQAIVNAQNEMRQKFAQLKKAKTKAKAGAQVEIMEEPRHHRPLLQPADEDDDEIVSVKLRAVRPSPAPALVRSRSPSSTQQILLLEKQVTAVLEATQRKVELMDEVIRSRSPSPPPRFQFTQVPPPPRTNSQASSVSSASSPTEEVVRALRGDVEHAEEHTTQAMESNARLEQRLMELEQEVVRLSASPPMAPAGRAGRPGRSALSQMLLSHSPPQQQEQQQQQQQQQEQEEARLLHFSPGGPQQPMS